MELVLLYPVCQPRAHWPVCAQPLFLSVNSPLDHSTPSSSSSFFCSWPKSSGWMPKPGLDTDLLSWSPWNFTGNELVQTQNLQNLFLSSTTYSFPTFSDRHVTLVSSPADILPGVPDELLAWYSCGMGWGVGQSLKEWECLFSSHSIFMRSRSCRAPWSSSSPCTTRKELQRYDMHCYC